MKLSYIFAGAALLGLLASCNRDLDTYEGENGIYFDTTYKGGITLSDTINVSWGMKNSSETSQVIELNVKLLGKTASVDRAFDIAVETEIMPAGAELPSEPLFDADGKSFIPTLDASAGVDFEAPATTYIIPANQAEVKIPVTVLRNETLHLGKRAFKLRLIENNNLKFLFSRSLPSGELDENGNTLYYAIDYQRVIVLDENFPIPTWWDIRGEPYFGKWSQKKASLICDVMNINREVWLEPAGLAEGYLKFCGRYMHNYLKENPHYEDDGETLMEMGERSTYE